MARWSIWWISVLVPAVFGAPAVDLQGAYHESANSSERTAVQRGSTNTQPAHTGQPHIVEPTWVSVSPPDRNAVQQWGRQGETQPADTGKPQIVQPQTWGSVSGPAPVYTPPERTDVQQWGSQPDALPTDPGKPQFGQTTWGSVSGPAPVYTPPERTDVQQWGGQPDAQPADPGKPQFGQPTWGSVPGLPPVYSQPGYPGLPPRQMQPYYIYVPVPPVNQPWTGQWPSYYPGMQAMPQTGGQQRCPYQQSTPYRFN